MSAVSFVTASLQNGLEKLQKAALGAERTVPTQHFGILPDALAYVSETYPDYSVIGLETTETSILYTNYTYSKKGVALILGNEVTGVDPSVLPTLDTIVEIPMFGSKNSLNVGVCAPIVLYEILRQWES